MTTVTYTPQDLIAIGSLATAILAFIATFWQAKIAREHNRKSTLPLLTVYCERRDAIAISVRNDGVGPALIKEMYYYVDGKPCYNIEEFDARFDTPDGIEVFRTSFTPPAAVGTGHSLELLVVRALPGNLAPVLDQAKRIAVKIRYESVYGESLETERYTVSA